MQDRLSFDHQKSFGGAMRFPINATQQKRCPVCKAAGPGTNSPVTPRPETASLSFAVWRRPDKGQTGPVVLGGDLVLGWDAGVSKHPKSRVSLGAAVNVATLQAPRPNEGMIGLQFCSIACLRHFLLAAVDELEQRAQAVAPEVQAARKRPENKPVTAATTRRKKSSRSK